MFVLAYNAIWKLENKWGRSSNLRLFSWSYASSQCSINCSISYYWIQMLEHPWSNNLHAHPWRSLDRILLHINPERRCWPHDRLEWDGDQPNRLHLTAVSQAVAFTLRALQTPPRDASWKTTAQGQLKTWNVVLKEIEETIGDDEVPSLKYRPSPGPMHVKL